MIIEKDKKIYNILKKNNFEKEDNQVYYQETNNNNIDNKTTQFNGENNENIQNDISNEESDPEKLNIKDLNNSNKKKNYLIEFDKNMDMQNFEEREDNLRTNPSHKFAKNTMNMTVAKRKEQSKPNNIQLKSDSNTPNNKFNYEHSEQASSVNLSKNNQLPNNNTRINQLDDDEEEEEEYLNQYNKTKCQSNKQQPDNILISSNNESEDSVYHYSNEIQSKLTNIVSGSNSKYNISENYTKNIQKLKNEMNVSEGEEENISTRDKYVPEM